MSERADVRAFGRDLNVGDTLVNLYPERGYQGGERLLTVVATVRPLGFFVLEDDDGMTAWARTRTLFSRYVRITRGR